MLTSVCEPQRQYPLLPYIYLTSTWHIPDIYLTSTWHLPDVYLDEVEPVLTNICCISLVVCHRIAATPGIYLDEVEPRL